MTIRRHTGFSEDIFCQCCSTLASPRHVPRSVSEVAFTKTSPVVVIYETSLAGIRSSKLSAFGKPAILWRRDGNLFPRLCAFGYSLRRLSSFRACSVSYQNVAAASIEVRHYYCHKFSATVQIMFRECFLTCLMVGFRVKAIA